MISMVERKDIISAYERTLSMRAVSRELGLSRKTVKKYVMEYLSAKSGGDEALVAYLKSEPSYKSAIREKRALTEDVCRMIDVCLRDNQEKRDRGDKKLCMKATDIHARLKSLGYKVSYPSVCNYIRTTLSNADELQECFIRQSYPPGRDCEFDWGELYLTIGGRRMKLYLAVFTLAYSNHRAAYLFLQQDTQAYMESHRLYFKMLGKVPHRMVYDNMRVAVASFVGGKHPTDALIRMESAYCFSHRFCNAHSGRNIVLYGNPGTGKTHVATALAIKACMEGMHVLFTSVPHLITQIKECKSAKTLHQLEGRFKKYDLVVCDEFGYVSCDKEAGELLFNHLSLRADTKSTIITTNLAFDRWGEIIKDKVLVTALVDRLTHNAFLVNMNGESYRLKETKKFNEQNR